MWHHNHKTLSVERKEGGNGLVAVAIDKDNKGSQYALKWAIDNLHIKGQTIILIHVDVHSHDVILEDTDVVKAIVEYVAHAGIECLVLGASRHGFLSVYVISKGKISSVRNASRSAPFTSPLHTQIMQNQTHHNASAAALDSRSGHSFSVKGTGRSGYHGKLWGEISELETDISFISSSGRPSTEDRISVSSIHEHNNMESGAGLPSRGSTSSDHSFGSSLHLGPKWTDTTSHTEFSDSSLGSIMGRSSSSSQGLPDDVEAEMRRLKLELKQTMELYSTACKEALCSKQKAIELHHWRLEEERRLEEARRGEELALAIAEKEKAKSRAAMEAAEAAQRIAEREAQRRISAEMRILSSDALVGPTKDKDHHHHDVVRYRKYSIEEIEAATEYFAESRKIGEGGYGPVYRCYLDHTRVAVKVLRPDAAQGRAQFQREVEILSCMRHPNMVLLLGACPEYGCLVYEYMANGSLEDRLFRRGNTPSLSWKLRFRIAAEVATGLLFLHQTKPEPLVHRDLKPANILLDQNYVSKISDVGLARLVPPSVADDVTQYRMTSTAGTFCYIDPEYQQTGMLGVKSDVYSLGIVLLQLLTAKPAMGLAHHVGRSIEKGTFGEILDPSEPDWPVKEALCLAEVAVQCAELRRKDRPDLGKEVLPELNRLRELAEESMSHFMFMLGSTGSAGSSPYHSQVSSTPTQDVMSDPTLVHSGCESSKSNSTSFSMTN
ncbi:hypothetical protein U1Q18_006215 [Sarracenia purpurea var. burkii]